MLLCLQVLKKLFFKSSFENLGYHLKNTIFLNISFPVLVGGYHITWCILTNHKIFDGLYII